MDRVEKAVNYHKQGFNCAQAVAMAFADIYSIDGKTMAKLSCSYGGGIGRQGLTCGAVLGMCLLVGMQEGNDMPTDTAKRKNCYLATQILCNKFKTQYGSMDCKDIIGINPCSEKVRLAAKIFDDYLKMIEK